jgi:hypothetical protein
MAENSGGAAGGTAAVVLAHGIEAIPAEAMARIFPHHHFILAQDEEKFMAARFSRHRDVALQA